MSSTISTNKRAGAFCKPDGTVIYVLFEETYESNVTPKTPRWSVVALGPRNDVLKRIFLRASSCEGGMLKSRAGDIRPENYIETWKQHLAKPLVIDDLVIDLSTGTSYRSPIAESALEAIRPRMVKLGFEAQFGQIEAGSLKVSLHRDIDLLLALYGVDGPFAPWRALGDVECRNSILEVEPVPNVKVDRMPRVKAYRLDKGGGDNVVVLSVNGEPFHVGGWDYNAVEAFLDLAYEYEVRTPGFAKVAIPWFRDTLKGAPPLPGNTFIVVKRDLEDENAHSWRGRTLDRLAVAVGAASSEGATPLEFGFQLQKLEGKSERLYDLCAVPKAQVVWDVVPEVTVVESQQQAGATPDDWQHELQVAFDLV